MKEKKKNENFHPTGSPGVPTLPGGPGWPSLPFDDKKVIKNYSC